VASEKRLAVLITANAKQAQQEFGKLGSAAEQSGKRTTRALSGIQSGLIGLGVGAAALGSFKAFEESERIARQTEAVIKSTGGSAQVTSKHIGDLASEISKLGGVDDELVQQGENMLLTFTKVRNEAGKGNDIFDQATRAANDYAAATGTDVVNANKMLGKALNDPIKGLTALTRAGVSFTQQQKDQIRTLVESGDTMGAQKIILAEFQKEYGGSLEANATASGKAQVALENMGESVGAVLAPALTTGANALAFFADGFSGLPSIIQTASVGVAGLGAAAVIAGPRVMESAQAIKSAAGLARTWGTELVAALDGIAATRGVSRTTAGLEALKGSLRTTPAEFGTFKSGMAAAAAGATAFTITLTALEESVKFHGDLEGLSTDLTDMADGLITPKEALEELGGSVDGLADKFRRADKDSLGKRFASSFSDISKTRQANSDIKALDQSLAEMVKSGNIDSARKAYGELAGAMIEQGVSAETVASLLPNYNDAMERSARRAGDHTSAVDGNTAAQDDNAKATRNTTEFYKKNADALQKIRDNAAEATSKIKEFYDESTNQVSDQIDVERALDAASQSFKDNGTALSISAEGGRANREAIIAARDAQLEYAMTLRDTSGTGAAIESMVNYSNRLYDTMVQAGFTKEQAAALIDEMGLTPKDIYTTFRSNATEAEQAAADVKRSIEDVPGWKDIYFNALTQEAMYQIHALSKVVSELGGSVLSGTAGAAIQQSQAAHQGRWGAVTAYAKGGITPAHITRDQLFKYGEPATGGEAFVPRKGDKKRSTAILGEAAGWYGMQVVPMAKGGLNRSWGEAGVKVGTVFEDGSVVTAADMERYRRSQRQTATFGSASTTVNPGRPPAVFGSSTGAGITINVFEAKDARNTARQVVAEINRATRMGQSPLVGSRR